MIPALQLFRDTLFGDPAIKQEERIDLAMKAVAKCQGGPSVSRCADGALEWMQAVVRK